MAFAIVLAGPLGVIAAWRRGPGGSDHHGPVVLAFSVPVFLVGYGLVIGFALTLDLLRCRASSLRRGPVAFLRPSCCRRRWRSPRLYRAARAHHPGDHARNANEDFVRTARARGSRAAVLVLHALKNASVPIVTTSHRVALLIRAAWW